MVSMLRMRLSPAWAWVWSPSGPRLSHSCHWMMSVAVSGAFLRTLPTAAGQGTTCVCGGNDCERGWVHQLSMVGLGLFQSAWAGMRVGGCRGSRAGGPRWALLLRRLLARVVRCVVSCGEGEGIL